MKTIRFTLLLFLISILGNAQVGVGNTDPKASLDVSASNAVTPANTDGILIPRIDNFPATNPAADQDGMMVFVTGNGTPAKGFYYWDNSTTSWVTVIGVDTKNTLDGAYDEGGNGAGKNIIADNGAVRINGSDGFLVTGTLNLGNTINSEITGPGTRMFFNPNRAAFRAGIVDGAEWDNVNIGNYSMALGHSITAGGNFSTAFGYNNIASNSNSTVFGRDNISSGASSTVFGSDNEASGNYATAFGEYTTASGTSSISAGYNSIASDSYTVAIGLYTSASNDYAIALGRNTTASGRSTFVTGFENEAPSAYETVMGMYSTLYAPVSAIGFNSNDRLFVIGNGEASTLRSNALTIYKSGLMNINDEYNMPLIDGANGQVMTTDGAGNVAFQDPIISVQRIDNLLDGKSDNDGSDDGSSIFLGINAGASDDGTNNWNIGIGFEALQNSTSAAANIGIGFNALKANLTGNSNIGIGSSTMLNNTIGFQNTAIGNSAMIMNTTGRDNVANGHFSLFSNTYGVNNISIGSSSIFSNTGGSNNVGIGSRSLYLNNLGNGNIGIGGSTGYSNISGDFNIFLGFNSGYFETGSNKLYIENSDADADNALIYGEFDNDILRTNGELQIGNPTISGYSLPTTDGTNGQVLTTDGAGNTSWQDTSSPTLSLARITMSVNQTIGTTGWQKLDYDTVDFDLNSNFDAVNDEFDVASTGFYRINATWRSATTSTSTNSFGIAIAVNGTIERAKVFAHSGNGIILRSINSVLDLNAGQRVEIYIYSVETITAFNNEIPVYFEIEQIR
jgi:YadA head domain repeat (2 copies)